MNENKLKEVIREIIKTEYINEGRIINMIQRYANDERYRNIILAKNKEELSKSVQDFRNKYGDSGVQTLLKLLKRNEVQEITTTGMSPGSEEYIAVIKNIKNKRKYNQNTKKVAHTVEHYNMIKEEITPDDWADLKKVIRMEVALIMFDLYKKRTTWSK